MPTYQYACTNPDCGEQFELVQSFTDPAASECPVCGAPVRKVFSAVGVVFKGSGFYRTDSRNESKKSPTSSSSSSSSASSGSSSGSKSESSSSSSGSSSKSASDAGSAKPAKTPAASTS